MAKKINEAQVKIDIAGLESDDLKTLSRMLALAGQAERQDPVVAAPVPSMGSMTPSLPPIAPLDLDSIGAEEEIGGIETSVEDPLAAAVDDLSADVGDFGADTDEVSMDAEFSEPGVEGEEDFSLDLSGQPQLESVEEDDEEEEEIIEEEFDFSRMLSLAGINEEEDEDFSVEGNPATDKEMKDTQFLPDLSISEDEEPSNSTDYGPYDTEADAVRDGQLKTNGVEGDHFVVIAKGNQFYWRRVVDEDLDNRPEPEYYDNEGNENRVHKFEPKFPGTALGDNPLNVNESEEDDSPEGNIDLEDDSDEEVEDIFESLQEKYKKFLGDK
ncbi:TPA: hypothetical protein IFA33_000856 [Escherichia coli]|nr:hypothetical protein [Escherichia coli]